MNKRLLKIEKMLILIQERDHYFNNNKKKIKITESEKESIAKLMKELSEKILDYIAYI